MGANAVTTVPVYTAGEVLTAADMNITNSGIPVFASSVERDAAFGGTGEKTLAEGQYAYLESTKQTLVYDGSNWVSVGTTPGMVLVSATTIGSAVATVTVSGAFSATYDNYRIIIAGGAASTSGELFIQVGAKTTGYASSAVNQEFSSGTTGTQTSTTRVACGRKSANGLSSVIDITSPNLAKNTGFTTTGANATYGMVGFGNTVDTSTYTAFTIIPDSGTLTGGVIRVYGYTNS